jgi:hypothetical protein
MSDARPFDSFHMLDGPIQPDAAFAGGLFEALAADLGFRPDTRRRAIARRFHQSSPVFRVAYIAAMLGLLLAAAIVVALVGARLLNTRTAAEIVAVKPRPPLVGLQGLDKRQRTGRRRPSAYLGALARVRFLALAAGLALRRLRL